MVRTSSARPNGEPRPRRARLARALLLVVLATVTSGAASAERPSRAASSAPRPRATPLGARLFDTQRRADAGRAEMATTNFGSFAYDMTTGNSGLWWPRGSNQSVIFAAGLWLGATVGGDLRVSVSEYSSEYGPGPMVGATFDDPNRPEHVVYKVVGWHGDPLDTAHVEHSPGDPGDLLVHHGWGEYVAKAKPRGAPTRMWRLPLTATPAPDDSVDVEGPDLVGDQMLWEVHNDANPALHDNNAGTTPPLGVEVQQSAFTFDRPDEYGDLVLIRFRILNKGGNTLDQFHASVWSDPDLGFFLDDLVGCDVPRSMGFCYNATASDLVFGNPPPAMGVVLLKGLTDPQTQQALGMTAFGKYINGTDPASALESYNAMRGLQGDGSPNVDPTTGLPTPFMVSGDPLSGSGWLDALASDRRMLVTTGPVTMAPGATQELWAAIVIGRSQDAVASVAAVRCGADLAREAFEAGFPTPPPVAAEPCSVSAAAVAQNCPRAAGFWAAQCPSGGSALTGAQLVAVATDVDAHSLLFDWGGAQGEFLCSTLSPGGALDARRRARREYATFLANRSGGALDLQESGGARIWLNPTTPVSVPPLRAQDVTSLAAMVDTRPTLIDAAYLDDVTFNRRALEGVNVGLTGFNGGAGVGWDFFGSSLDPVAEPDSFHTVEIRFDHTTTQQAYRYLRLERQSDGAPPTVGRAYRYAGFRTVPFTCRDVTTNELLEVGFVERAITDDFGTLLASAFQPATFDSTWGPDDSAVGGREYLFVFRRPFSGVPSATFTHDDAIEDPDIPTLYALWAKKRTAGDVIDDGDGFRFVWGRHASPGVDSLMVELEAQSPTDPAVVALYDQITDGLAAINSGAALLSTCGDRTLLGVASLAFAQTRAGVVSLAWQLSAASAGVSIERREGTSADWVTLAVLGPRGPGLVAHEDSTVSSGRRYTYRLALVSGTGTRYSDEAAVTVPERAGLLVRGLAPGSPRGRLRVALSLASSAPARLELLDVAGRRVVGAELGGLGPGEHTVDLGPTSRLASGIYWLRLRQDGATAGARVVLVR